MKSYSMRYLPIILSSIFAISPAFAELLDSRLLSFNLQPNICVTKQVGDVCKMKAKLNWQTSAPMSLCLLQNEQTVKCWDQKNIIQEPINIELIKQSNFTLLEQYSQKPLAQQTLKINYQTHKRYRRRLRSEWSIF